ncbi:MAG TPA: hypothetical protein VIJ55_11810 [Acetobacteraceae bacterium]
MAKQSADRLPDFGPAMVRLRAIADASGDRLLLGDGPPHPDARLLDICSTALHHLKEAEKAYAARHDFRGDGPYTDKIRAEDERLMTLYNDGVTRAKPPLVLIARIPAKTAAGIYAKALLVRLSKTGAAGLAMSLADDLVNNPGLREALWSADPVEASTERA